jgi:molybdopterin-synthase adenylyltransferase
MAEPFFILPRDAADHIANSPNQTEALTIKHLLSEDLYVVDGFFVASDARLPTHIPARYETLKWEGERHAGTWFKGLSPEVNIAHWQVMRRPGVSMMIDAFLKMVPGAKRPRRGESEFVITYSGDLPEELLAAGARRYACWILDRNGAQPADVAREPETLGIDQLVQKWPIGDLKIDSVMVVGLGSIGGVVADSLAEMGVGRTVLVDPDRFLWHNIVRHVLGPEAVGRFKVDAMRDHLKARWPEHTSVPLQVDVVTMADLIRPRLPEVDMVVCGADGIAPRRVVSHLARRAGLPAVLACVLDDGGVGEVLRLRPGPRYGCLLCHRAEIAAAGGIDPEADQELDYGTGFVHKPMTAIPTDLHTVGKMAAKIAVSTLLESKHGFQLRLPGEQAVIGFRSDLNLAPPYDVARAGEVAWHEIPGPRGACATCSQP